MEIEDNNDEPLGRSPRGQPRKNKTPSTYSSIGTPMGAEGNYSQPVSEFILDPETAELSKLMGSACLEEK